MSEEDDIKDKSISDVNEYDTNITISKVNKIEKSKTQKPKSQLTLPKVRDSSLFINDVSRQEKFLNAIISNDQKSNFDYTKELNYMWNLMKSQQILSNWFRNDYIKSKVVNDAENYENFDNLSHINSIQKIEVPRLNYEMLDKNIKFVWGKRFVNFYLSQKGEIYSSGKNIWGVLGREGTKQGSRFYTQTLMEISAESKIKLVKSGLKHAICLTETNEIYTWGYNNLGQLGLNLNETKANIKSEINFETGEIFNYINTPEPIPFFLKNNRSILISEISCGNDFTIALTTAGKLYGWGDNTFNQLGVNNQTSSIISQSQDEGKFFIEEPVQISWMIDSKRDLANISKEESRIESIICGTEYSYAISQDLKVRLYFKLILVFLLGSKQIWAKSKVKYFNRKETSSSLSSWWKEDKDFSNLR